MQPFTPIERLFTARVQPGYGDGKGHNHGENSNAAQIYPSPPGGFGIEVGYTTRIRYGGYVPVKRPKLSIKVSLQP